MNAGEQFTRDRVPVICYHLCMSFNPERGPEPNEFEKMGFPKMPKYLESVRCLSDSRDPNRFQVLMTFKKRFKPTIEDCSYVLTNYVAPVYSLHGFNTTKEPAETFQALDKEGRYYMIFTFYAPRERVFGGTEENPLNLRSLI